MLLALLATVGAAQPAVAHADLVSTTPTAGEALAEAPDAVELRFDEPVRLVDGAIRLLTADAEPTPLPATAVDATVVVELPALAPDAAYSVAWRVVSADGHPVGGVLSFTIGDAEPGAAPVSTEQTPGATESLVRVLSGLLYLGLLAFAGMVACTRLVLRASKVTASAGLAERVALGLASAAAVLLVPASGMRVVGAGPGSLSPSTWVPGVSWQVVAVALAVVVLGWGAHLLRRSNSKSRDVLAVVLAGGAAVSPVLVGHTLAYSPALMVAADAAHLLGGSVWLGGLLAMLVFLHGRPQKTEMRAALGRFSSLAVVAVGVIAITGTGMAVLVLDSPSALVATTYGRMLLVKVMVVAAVVALAAWVRWRLLPTSGSRPKFFRALRHEVALLVAVALLTGFLSNASPSHEHSHHGSQQVRAESQGLVVEGVLDQGVGAGSTFEFRLEFDGEAVTGDSVEVSFRMPEQDLGPVPAEVESRSDGSWTAAVDLPVPGVWQVQVAARVSKYERPIVVFDLATG